MIQWAECSLRFSVLMTRSSDFENKFICGEIMAYEDLHEHGSETAVKASRVVGVKEGR